jgi:hypothetical protein
MRPSAPSIPFAALGGATSGGTFRGSGDQSDALEKTGGVQGIAPTLLAGGQKAAKGPGDVATPD